MYKRKKSLTAVLVVVFLFSSIHLTTSKAAKIKLNNKKTIMKVGEKITLKVKGQVKWKSSNKKVASITSKGTVTAKRKGTVKITAYNKKQKATCHIKVISKDKNKKYSDTYSTNAVPSPQITDMAPTSTLVPISTPTPAPISTPAPTPISTPTPTPEDNKKPIVAADIWLFFDIEQNEITKNTTTLSGTMFKCDNTVIRVKVNDTVIAEKYYYESSSTFEIQTNFSDYQAGDKIEVIREYLGEKTQTTPTSTVTVWNMNNNYVLSE